MKDELVAEVMQQMLPYLDNAQLKQLRLVMEHTLFHYDISDIAAKTAASWWRPSFPLSGSRAVRKRR